MSAEVRATIDIIRALVISQKNPTSIEELLRDYRSMEGCPIPFKKFGFQSLDRFLESSNEFLLNSHQGKTCVTARPTKESAHITKMIASQKTSKKVKGPTKYPSFSASLRSSDNYWNRSSSNIYQRVNQNRAPHPSNRFGNQGPNWRLQGDSNNNISQNNNNRNLPSSKQFGSDNKFNAKLPGLQQNDFRNKLNAKEKSEQNFDFLNKPDAKKQTEHNSDLRRRTNAKEQINPNLDLHNMNQNSRPHPSNGCRNQVTDPKLQGDSNNNIYQNNRNLPSSLQFGSDNKFNAKLPGLQQNDLRNKLNAKEKSEQNFDFRDKLDAKKQAEPNFDLRNKLNARKQSDKFDSKKQSEPISELHSKHNVKEQIDPNLDLRRKIDDIRSKLEAKKFEKPSLLDLSLIKPNKKRNRRKRKIIVSVQNRLESYRGPQIATPNIIMDSPVPSISSIPLTPNQSSESFSIKASRKTTSNTELNVKEIKISLSGFQFDNTLNPTQSLEEYCRANRYDLPNYEIIGLKTSKKFQCLVKVNGIMYTTYPNEYKDMQTAQVACAKLALDEIKFALSNRNNYPVWSDSDQELATVIYEDMRQNHPHGIFVKALPKIFEDSFKFLLPDHWISIINDSNKFLMENSAAGGDKIIMINKNLEIDLNLTDGGCEKLKLPWEQKNWCLYFTNCVSTVEIWACIVGPDYSGRLKLLLKEIELNMLTNRERPTSITTGKFYLVFLSKSWYRVRLEQIDEKNRSCWCFFIDFGDEEKIQMESLYICDPKFLKLPPQAIVFSLFGYEDFQENPTAKQHLTEILMHKKFIAEIKTKKDTFDKYCEENGASSINIYNLSLTIPRIQIVLYDTSHPTEDIMLNPLILKTLGDNIHAPELEGGSATNVTITHITDQGDIFLQIKSTGVFYVEKLIHQLVESKFNEKDNRVTLEDILKPNLFLIRDNEDNKWYRGCLAENEWEPNEENWCIFYVDFGVTKNIHESQIFRLESLSVALSKFPNQVIKTRLHNIPNMSKTIVDRIKALLPINYPAIVKLVNRSLDDNCNLTPNIIAYVRFDGKQGVWNVNEAISIEEELER